MGPTLDAVEHEIKPSGSDLPLPFQDLDAPEPIAADPPPVARWTAFLLVLVGGLLGGLVGFGVGDLMGGTQGWALFGAVIGGLTGAAGTGVVANLTLQAMNEWNAVEHPEAAADGEPDERNDPDAEEP